MLFVATGASFAEAQEPAPSSATPSPTSAPAPVGPNFEERLDEIDQRSRIALRKLEMAEEAAAAQAAKEKERAAKDKERANVKIGPSGLSISSADGAYSVALRAILQVDGRIFVNDEHKLTDAFIIRRARPIFDATMGKNFTVRIMPDFGGGQTVLQDAYIDARAANEFGVTVGKFKPTIGLERMQNEQATYFVERGYPSSIIPSRDVGIAIHGDLFEGKLGYSVGMYNGTLDGGAGGDIEFDDSKEFSAHVYVRPFATQARFTRPKFVSGLFIGVGATRGEKTGTPANTYLPVYRTSGQNTFFQYIADTSAGAPAGATTVAAGVENRLTGHIYAPIGPVAFLGEYVIEQERVARGTVSKLITLQAWNVTAAVALTGEDARFEGIVPKNPFDLTKGHVGAIELAARYSGMIIDRDAFGDFANDQRSARYAAEFGAGLNWYATRNYSVKGDYIITEFRSGGATAAGGRRDLEQVFLLRNQIAF
ncbi:OprO/OprP family phosphate-selective porin [Pendulispora brunnea]|uniref:OprO/OprP family phosphate-selective porin n=1 Tax=Pendulispora brunnea TaxID=2905690 RepID=A0ABZ2KDA0_9BACT